VVPALQGTVILALFAGVAALGGKVWWELWSPAPSGIVYQKQWIPQPYAEGERADFAGTGWYVVVAVVAGLLLGVIAGLLLDRNELVTLAAVAAGSALAAWLMLRVGVSFSAPDPEALAKTAKEGSELPGRLDLSGNSPLLAFPIGSMAGLAIALFGISKRRG
jgi:ABC-type nitrate/sulfonate/bicarbonate transport system permease component